jgi:hypothetical protein
MTRRNSPRAKDYGFTGAFLQDAERTRKKTARREAIGRNLQRDNGVRAWERYSRDFPRYALTSGGANLTPNVLAQAAHLAARGVSFPTCHVRIVPSIAKCQAQVRRAS